MKQQRKHAENKTAQHKTAEDAELAVQDPTNAEDRHAIAQDRLFYGQIIACKKANIPGLGSLILKYLHRGHMFDVKCHHCQKKMATLDMATCSHRCLLCMECADALPCTTVRMRTFQRAVQEVVKVEHETMESLRHAVESHMTCPVCLDVAPLMTSVLCHNGHGVCIRCRLSLKTHSCPICRAMYGAEVFFDTYSGCLLHRIVAWMEWADHDL